MQHIGVLAAILSSALEHIPIRRNRDVLQIPFLAHVLFGKPVSTFPGHALGGVAAGCWACHSVWSRPFIARSSPLTFVTVGMGIGAASLAVLALARADLDAVVAFRPAQWAAVAYLAIFGGAAAFYLWIFALQHATPTSASSTIAVHPIGASLFAAIVIGEPLRFNLALGVAAVLAGIFIAARTPRPLSRQPTAS